MFRVEGFGGLGLRANKEVELMLVHATDKNSLSLIIPNSASQ